MQTSFYYWAIGAAATLAVLTTGYYFVFGTPGDLSTLMVEERVSERDCTEEELLDPTVDCVRPQLMISGLEECAGAQGIDASVSCLAEVDPALALEADEHPLIDVEETENGYVLILPGGVREEVVRQPLTRREQILENLQGDWQLSDVQVRTGITTSTPVSSRYHQLGGILRISGNRWFFNEKASAWDKSHCEQAAQRFVPADVASQTCNVTCEVTGPDWMYGVIDPHPRTSRNPDIGGAITMFMIPTADRNQPKSKIRCLDPQGAATVEGDAINPLLLATNVWGIDIWADGQGNEDDDGEFWVRSRHLEDATIDSMVLSSVTNFGNDALHMTFQKVR